MAATCSSCGAEVVWARTASGKATPLDAKLTRVYMIRDGQAVAAEGRQSHWATCPSADSHRKPKS